MKRIVAIVCGLGLSSTLAFADQKSAPGQIKKTEGAPTPAQTEAGKKEMLAAMEKAAMPGPEHKGLMESVGTWSCVSKMQMDPGKPPMESKGTEEVSAVLGGRFIQFKFSGTMMGKPFEGLGLEGYDNVNKKYVITWADTMGTMLIHADGSGTANERTYSGEETMPHGMKRAFRWVVKREGKDKRTMEFYGMGPDGKEHREGEIVYTRTK